VPDEGVIADLKQQGIMAIITEKKQVFIPDGKYSIAKNELVVKRDALLKFSLKSISLNYMGYETMKVLKFILSTLLEIEIIGKRVSILID